MTERVTTSFAIDREGVAVVLAISGDYYPGDAVTLGSLTSDPEPGSGGRAHLTAIEFDGAPFWGELTDGERDQAEHAICSHVEDYAAMLASFEDP